MYNIQLSPAIEKIIRKRRASNFITSILFSLALSLLMISFASYLFKISNYWVIPLFFTLLTVQAFLKNIWQEKPNSVVSFLDRNYAELEESSGLFLKSAQDLTGLEVLQKQKIGVSLDHLKIPFFVGTRIFKGLAFLIFSIIIYATVLYNPRMMSAVPKGNATPVSLQTSVKENVPGSVLSFSLGISPPAYTNRQRRTQQQFNLKVESGSVVEWSIKTTKQIKQLNLIFNNNAKFKMRPVKGSPNEWQFTKNISQQGFYQVELDGLKSELYQIETVPDLPVRIKINTPKQRTIIDVGQPQRIGLNVSMSDDYGIRTAFIAATMASGKGEGVSFTEKKLPFHFTFNNQTNTTLKEQIDLKSLGMKPGDELYFYISATDNHNQQSRSDVYFVSIVDTTELMSLAGMSNGVNLVPEYFRSQRQIIIDTEKLLKEQSTLQDKQFKDKSNEIGIDQKLLRLRYGKFLGEESETEIGADHDHKDGDHDEKTGDEKFGDVTAIMDQYAHKHDVAEDATFFEPELKAQLKAVLTEMWGSELRLRTYRPQEALPYEYKALRLLKDLQQKSRAYVAKTTVKTSQLKLEKRLTGELDKIQSPVFIGNVTPANDREFKLRQSLAILEMIKSGLILGSKQLDVMRNVEAELILSASANPRIFLPALANLRKVIGQMPLKAIEISSVQQAILKLIPKGQAKPMSADRIPGNTLYEGYYNNLKRGGL